MFKHELVAVDADVDGARRTAQAIQVLEARVGCCQVVLVPGVVAKEIDTAAPIQEVATDLAEVVHVRSHALRVLGREICHVERVKSAQRSRAQGSEHLSAQSTESGHFVAVVTGVVGLLE